MSSILETSIPIHTLICDVPIPSNKLNELFAGKNISHFIGLHEDNLKNRPIIGLHEDNLKNRPIAPSLNAINWPILLSNITIAWNELDTSIQAIDKWILLSKAVTKLVDNPIGVAFCVCCVGFGLYLIINDWGNCSHKVTDQQFLQLCSTAGAGFGAVSQWTQNKIAGKTKSVETSKQAEKEELINQQGHLASLSFVSQTLENYDNTKDVEQLSNNLKQLTVFLNQDYPGKTLTCPALSMELGAMQLLVNQLLIDEKKDNVAAHKDFENDEAKDHIFENKLNSLVESTYRLLNIEKEKCVRSPVKTVHLLQPATEE